MTPFKKNCTESIDNLNKIEKYTEDEDMEELKKKVDFIYRLAGGE